MTFKTMRKKEAEWKAPAAQSGDKPGLDTNGRSFRETKPPSEPENLDGETLFDRQDATPSGE